MTALDLLILALAAWRGAYFLVKEDAPFYLMKRFRGRYPLGGLLNCVYCSSVWCAFVAYLAWLTPLQPLVIIAAVSGGAMMLHRYTGGDHL